jgi:hypothetical protein
MRHDVISTRIETAFKREVGELYAVIGEYAYHRIIKNEDVPVLLDIGQCLGQHRRGLSGRLNTSNCEVVHEESLRQ